MDRQEIHKLMEKYYGGETTLEEERLLLDFLKSDTTPEFQSEKAQFLFFETARKEGPSKVLFDEAAPNVVHGIGHFRLKLALRAAAVLVIALGLGYSLFILLRTPMSETSTEANVQSELKLSDGSHVWVHSSSRLRYPPAFAANQREVFLEGEAYFEIVKDPARPFIVHTHETTTKVVGTSFDLRNYGKEEHVELTVFMGKVIFGSDEKVEVAPGNQIIFEKRNKQMHKSQLKGLNALAWKTRQLEFADAPMSEVLADLSRYYNVRFEQQKQNDLICHFSGTYKDPKLDDVLKAIAFSTNVSFRLEQDIYYIDAHNCSATQ